MCRVRALDSANGLKPYIVHASSSRATPSPWRSSTAKLTPTCCLLSHGYQAKPLGALENPMARSAAQRALL